MSDKETWDLKRLKNEVVSTTGCKVSDLAICIIISSYLHEVSKGRQSDIIEAAKINADLLALNEREE